MYNKVKIRFNNKNKKNRNNKMVMMMMKNNYKGKIVYKI